MVVSTIVENGKTVRTWQELRGYNKTLTRKFFIYYRVNAICNGKWYSVDFCDTKEQALSCLNDTKKKVHNKYGLKQWLNMSDHEVLTHEADCGFWQSIGCKKSVKLYITEECKAGEKCISEVIS